MDGDKMFAVLLAAGSGKRMGADVRKQFLQLCGKPLLVYAAETLQQSPLIDEIVLVTAADCIAYCAAEIVEKYRLTKIRRIVPGGKERYDSVYEGLKACEGADYVLIHDGARPFLDDGILERTAAAVRADRACAVGMPSKDTVKIADADGYIHTTPPRDRVWNIQTPQAFSFPLLWEAHCAVREKDKSGVTDDAMLVETETGVPVRLVEGSYENIKITTPEDLDVAKALLKRRRAQTL